MGRVCVICVAKNRATIDAALMGGVADRVVSRQFRIANSSVQRHRTRHIIRPMQDRLAILSKGTEEERQRQELTAAAGADTPSIQQVVEATLGMRRQMEKLDAIEARLERMASASEQSGSPNAVSQLSAQQLRSIEVGAKLGSVGGYKSPSAIPQTNERNVVSIEFVFQNAPPETIALTGRPVIDGDFTDPNWETPVPPPPPKQKFQGSIRDYWDFSERQLAQSEDARDEAEEG